MKVNLFQRESLHVWVMSFLMAVEPKAKLIWGPSPVVHREDFEVYDCCLICIFQLLQSKQNKKEITQWYRI